MVSEVYFPEGRTGWWGGPDKRLRCRADDKVVFVTKQQAEEAAAKATARGDPMIHYRGRCGHLHIARKWKKMLNDIVKSLFRGYGWTLGRRLANRSPLWFAILLIFIYFVSGGR